MLLFTLSNNILVIKQIDLPTLVDMQPIHDDKIIQLYVIKSKWTLSILKL